MIIIIHEDSDEASNKSVLNLSGFQFNTVNTNLGVQERNRDS